MRTIIWAALVALGAPSVSAHAEWLEASSDHFVIYSNDSERDVTQFANKLERYHAALEVVTDYHAPAPSPSNRVTVYVVSNEMAVKKLYGAGSTFVDGFYIPRAGGSLAIVPEAAGSVSGTDGATIVLLHEYAHHFLTSANTMPTPRWMTEGAAEFFSATSFEPDGGMKLGRPARHRGYELFSERDVQAADLLDPTEYDKRKSNTYDAFYGKSWLLYHYLTFDAARKGQLKRYATLLEQGVGLRAAGQQAFGDFVVLEADLDRYLVQRRFSIFTIAADKLKTNPVRVRRVTAGEAAMMQVRIRSSRGVDDAVAKTLAGQARAIAARFPKDAAVLSSLAEAEHDVGNDKAAVAAAEQALAIDPAQVNAYVQEGYALFRMAKDEKDQAAAYKRAMVPFLKLNKIENDHPLPLVFNYRSFVEQGSEPTRLAISGLARASELAPFDLQLRTALAMALFKAGRKDEARTALTPIAYNPHGGGLSLGARKVLEKLDAEPNWSGADAMTILASGSKGDTTGE